MTRRLGPAGADLIKSYEGLKTEAYRPTENDVPTLGYGHTRGVKMGDTCTIAQAEAWFREDVAGAEKAVNALGVPMSQGQFDALVSFAFNVGAGSLGEGTTVGNAMRERRWFNAWIGLALWTKQAGKDLRGLARRRAQEMALFMSDPLP
jgi:lysozyme